MVKGTVDKVIEKTELKTLELRGNNLPLLQNTLEQNKDITTMSLFGGVLRICGEDKQKLIDIIAPYQKQYNLTWQPTNTYLEDAFIYYLKKAMEN